MSVGTTLLNLQELDLALMRNREALDGMPEVRELARKRQQYRTLKLEAQRLLGVRKDVEIDLADLTAQRAQTESMVEASQVQAAGLTDYRAVRDFESELSGLAKRLDKLSFAIEKRTAELDEARAQETRMTKALAKLEASVRAEADRTRAKAGDLLAEREKLNARRADLVHEIPMDLFTRYEAVAKRFKGMAVERLVGNKPSACRVALQPSQMGDLKHAGEVAECPYCHRILIRPDDAAEEAQA